MPTASMSARLAAARPTPSASSACWPWARLPTRSRASTRRSASTSARPVLAEIAVAVLAQVVHGLSLARLGKQRRRGVKFGPIPIDRGRRRYACACDHGRRAAVPQGAPAYADDMAALKAAGITEVVAAVLAPDDLERGCGGRKDRRQHEPPQHRGQAGRDRPGQPPRRGCRDLHCRCGDDRRHQCRRSDDHHRHAGAACAGRERPYGRDCEDHSLRRCLHFGRCGQRRSRMAARSSPSTPISRCVSASSRRCCPASRRACSTRRCVSPKRALARSGGRLTAERRTPHEIAPVAEAAASLARDNDMVVIFGASAMSDFGDVVPAAIEQAGGFVIRAGMPVDPGNLLVLGSSAASASSARRAAHAAPRRTASTGCSTG